MNTSYRDIDKLAAYQTELRRNGLKILFESLHHFFGCEVEVLSKPSGELLERYGINLAANRQRGCYVVDPIR